MYAGYVQVYIGLILKLMATFIEFKSRLEIMVFTFIIKRQNIVITLKSKKSTSIPQIVLN